MKRLNLVLFEEDGKLKQTKGMRMQKRGRQMRYAHDNSKS